MSVIRLEIRSRTLLADGAPFGEVGPYERLDGIVHIAVDPAHPANTGIVDLDLAERDATGRVPFSADFCLVQPVDPARGSGRLLLDVLNRGRKTVLTQFNRAPREPVPSPRIDPGDGFLMRRGWTIAWCGWQWDVIRSPALMGLEAPRARRDGRPIPGQVRVEFQPNEPMADHLLADRVHHPYPAADLNEADAVLTVRDWWDGPRTVIPRAVWRFARDEGGRPVPDPTRVWLPGGFEPGRIYEVIYTTSDCPVAGAGLLAVRDCAAFLRSAGAEAGNPCAGRVAHVYGFGASQSGRFLRHFLYLGLNLDEEGRQVFDGLLVHIAGARRGEFNHRYAQPSVQYAFGFGHLPPFAADELTDPLTGTTDGLLRRQRARGGVPRIIATNTAAEYWRGDCALLHVDLAGERDVEPPPDMRVYHLAGTQHVSGSLPLTDLSPLDGSRGAHPFNVLDFSPLMRAALLNLDRWVTAGEEPPPSVFPRLGDGTAVPPEQVIARFRTVPGAHLPDPARLRPVPRLDLGPEAARGVGRYPPRLGPRYPLYVPAIDDDLNELGGIRLPDLTAPVATYTGWNPRHPTTGGTGQIISMLGSTLPFPATAAERAARGDPRPSIAERYASREEYLRRVRAAAEALATDGYLLAEDIDLVVRLAGERYDAFAAPPDGAASALPSGMLSDER
jgi:hypothetical protein